jgi:CheY-like chemotaxis protein
MTLTAGKNVLLVEDDLLAVSITERSFQSAPPGTRLQVVNDGREARRYMNGADQYADRTTHPLPDLILLDIHMPRFTGLEFLRWLREQAPEPMRSLPVVIVTASGLPADLNWARALGVQLILLKPIRWSTFWQELEAAGVLGK